MLRLTKAEAALLLKGKTARPIANTPQPESDQEKQDKYHRAKVGDRTWTDPKLGEITFDSRRELNRWIGLRQLEAGGVIRDLRRQVRYLLVDDMETGMKLTYVADFTYIENNTLVVEDSKGRITATYKKKKKLMKQVYGVDILET